MEIGDYMKLPQKLAAGNSDDFASRFLSFKKGGIKITTCFERAKVDLRYKLLNSVTLLTTVILPFW